MRFTLVTFIFSSLLGLVTAGPVVTRAGPEVKIINNEPRTLCLKVETGIGWFPTTTVCGGAPGINVAAGTTSFFHPSGNWAGAITPITRTGALGTRLELNFGKTGINQQGVQQPVTWYDADMELGMSGVTLGPSDGRKQSNGRDSLAGELDPLAKANAAWMQEKDWGFKSALWNFPQYVSASPDKRRLTYVYMDKGAPEIVRVFFQLTAKFNAYIVPGSVPGVYHIPGSLGHRLAATADDKSWQVFTQAMTITVFRWG
ncbi:MAG: hypothetical protein Q9166_002126 [cf. Caloplaca sp. 2 TL-2023]